MILYYTVFDHYDALARRADWCLKVEGRPMCIGRNQYVLDTFRKDVRDYLFERMDSILNEAQIEYIKWDFSRNITEAASALLPADRQKEIFHVLSDYCNFFPPFGLS